MSKSSNSRACPALGRNISPAECGSQRQSHLACPPDCAYNPFSPANYSQLLDIEERLDSKTLKRFAQFCPNPDASHREVIRAEEHGILGTNAFFVWNMFFAQDAEKKTFAQHWEQTGLPELKNDERVLWHGKTQMRIALVEVHRILTDAQVEAVDLLSPEPTPFLIQDRSLAGIAARFSTYLAWIYPLPHFWRLSGTATTLSDVAQFSAPEVAREIVQHLGGPLSEAEMRRWLAENFVKFNTALNAVARARRRQMFSSMDVKSGKAVYELRAPFAACCEQLDALPATEPDELSDEERKEGFADARVCFDAPPESKLLTPAGGKAVLGRVLLGQAHWRLEAFSSEKLSRLRRQFETAMGKRVRFKAERIEDLATQLKLKEPAIDESLVPPRLLQDPERIVLASSRVPPLPSDTSLNDAEQEFRRQADRAFLVENVPALNHRTPREAARDPALRPKLVQMIKQRVRTHDEENLRTGGNDDINWMILDLGLNELLFEPPPWRPTPAPAPGEEDEIFEPAEFAGVSEPDPFRPPAPRLPAAPLEVKEAARRLEDAMGLFETAEEAENELYASGATILDDAEQLCSGLTDTDLCFAIPFLLQAWFALVPRGCRAPEIDYESLERTFVTNLRRLKTTVQSGKPEKFESFCHNSPQPQFIMVLFTAFLEAAKHTPKKLRPRVEAEPIIMALLKSIVELLDAALRER